MKEEQVRALMELIDKVNQAQNKIDQVLNEIGDWYYVFPMMGQLFESLKILLPTTIYEDISYFYFEDWGRIISEDGRVFDFADKDKEVFIEYLKHTEQI